MEAPLVARPASQPPGRLAALAAPVVPRARAVWTAAFIGVGAWLVRDAVATPSTEWMFLFRLTDFERADYAFDFFRQLHTGIPPFLAAVEIGFQLLFDAPTLVSGPWYRAAVLLAYTLPFCAFARSRVAFAASLATSLVFVWALASRADPWPDWSYGVFFPLFLLGAIACAQAARKRRGPEGPAAWLCFGAGALLAMAELSRPFVLLILPFLALCFYRMLRPFSRRSAIALLAPFLILSGGWHAKLLIAHEGQLLWSNHGGFNLYRSWEKVVTPWPDFVGQPGWLQELPVDQPVRGTGRYRFLNWNSTPHSEKSRALTRSVAAWALRHPFSAAAHGAHRVQALLAPKGQHTGVIAILYGVLLPTTGLWLLANAAWLGVCLVRDRSLARLGHAHGCLIVASTLTLGFASIGETGEEARLATHLLPLLACLPRTPRASESA